MSRVIIPFPFFSIDITNGFPKFTINRDESMKKINNQMNQMEERIRTLEEKLNENNKKPNEQPPVYESTPSLNNALPVTPPSYDSSLTDEKKDTDIKQ